MLVVATALCIAFVVAACSPPKDDTPKVSGLRKVEMTHPDEAAVALTATKAGSLKDSTWEVGGFELRFGEAPQVHIAGEAVPIPGGVDGFYTIDEEGVVEVRALGQAKSGVWDGERLMVDGAEAFRKDS
jgi:hypothetical protein